MSAKDGVPNDTVHFALPATHTTSILGCHQRYTHYTSREPHVAIAHQYTSVRYAQPQKKADRFRRAKPLEGIFQPLDTRKTPWCPQRSFTPIPADAEVTEDCLNCEIWLPASIADQERERRPVLIWFHGGFLQFGHPTVANPAELVRRTGAIVVLPTYRMNLFGFLSCEEMRDPESGTVGNLGFWDQRLAIEWVTNNIHAFGGDKGQITIAGYSAGAYSAFHQTVYETHLPDSQAHIKRVIMMSNGCGLQPKSLDETRVYFLALAEALGVPKEASAKHKFEELRRASTAELLDCLSKVPLNCFRACTDGVFVKPTFMQDIASGKVGKTFARRDLKFIIGEVEDEHFLYAVYAPPESYFGLVQRLTVEYPAINANRLGALYAPKGQLPEQYKDWKDLFGHVYSDCQVQMSERGLLKALELDVPPGNIFRYRIRYRLRCVDSFLPSGWKVTHTADMPFWFAGNGYPIEFLEKAAVDAWVSPLAGFLAGDKAFNWGCSGFRKIRCMQGDTRKIEVEDDVLRDRYINLWQRLFAARKKL